MCGHVFLRDLNVRACVLEGSECAGSYTTMNSSLREQ